jgi:hypothetical protein
MVNRKKEDAKLMVQHRAIITCPHCGATRTEAMPTDACQWFYACASCAAVLRPKDGDCCVFCSYGDVPCPPIQEAQAAGRSGVRGC